MSLSILLVNDYLHQKNLEAIKSYKNIRLTIITNVNDIEKYNLLDFDCVYSPSTPINVGMYPHVKFIFGPHFSVFPNEKIHMLKAPNAVYVQPSEWVVVLWKMFSGTQGLAIEQLPFGVNTDKFVEIKPILAREKVFVYHKGRSPQELDLVKTYLDSKNVEYKIFSYTARYTEADYLSYLQDAKYGIWVGCHESQGFALEEALSCNVPLLVWNVRSMSQEYGQNYSYIPATTVSYWDDRCGEYFHEISELEEKYVKFVANIDKYSPREYILDNLSVDKCEQRLIEIINSIKV